ncbi:hypothetical protein PENSPDRAFT_283783 [Peniophora sp. CONT]|nr:hypothetical protein PENSPDRAFT_283783 [Peniophora sp. CONT]
MSMFQILDFAPQEGDAGARLHVRTRVAQTQSRVFLRLVVGNIAVATEIYDEGYDGVWRLEGEMPPMRSPSPFVSLTVQAVNQDNQVLDQETLGTFKYLSASQAVQSSPHRQSRSRVSSVSSNFSTMSNPALGIPLSMTNAANAAAAARRGSIASTMSSSSGHHGPPSIVHGVGHPRRILRRREPGEDDPNERVVLDFATPIDDLGRNFTDEERSLGRRLVQFDCELTGNRLTISGKAIRQDDYPEEEHPNRGMTISCIYRAGAETTYFTSVDVIQLLQYLADDQFKVEEKNRIRRNLEGFHPTTISKNRANLEAFFTQIMEFPTPKPRNIEKDVKVFTWETLSPAIDKIMSKYVRARVLP